VGISFGFLLSYVVITGTLSISKVGQKAKIFSRHFIPQNPHSNGETETDEFVGPDMEQNWHAFQADNHLGKYCLNNCIPIRMFTGEI
jgi:hypothetical protein